MTATVPEVDTLTGLDSDWDIVCEAEVGYPRTPCASPARWIIVRSCCAGPPAINCDQCKEKIMLSNEAWKCRVCDTMHVPAHLFASYVEPLNRS